MYEHLRMADDDATIEGWLVPFSGSFGGKDSFGTTFSARTDYRLDWFNDRPLLFNHGILPDTGMEPVGTIRSLEVRDTGGKDDTGGVWMKAQLDRQSQYFGAIREMVKKGQLFLSSGSVEHLVKINQRSGHVDVWPIVEGSLTTIPSNLDAEIPVHSFRAMVDAMPEMNDETTMRGMLDEHKDDVIVHIAKRDAAVDPEDAADGGADESTESSGVSLYERSFEDIRGDITELLNPVMPYGYGYGRVWYGVIATYSDHVIACRYEEGDDDGYWKIPYALGADGEPVLAVPSEWTPMEAGYLPVVRAVLSTAPLMFEANHLSRRAAAFIEYTEGLDARRFREGRMLSTGNLQTINDVADGLESHAKSLRDLHERAMARQGEAARAAYFANPIAQQWEIDLLDLGIT